MLISTIWTVWEENKANGITLPNTVYPFLRGGFRTTPSAGGLYPLEIYIVVGKVQGLVPGLYKYIPNGHKIMSVINGDVRSEVYVEALGLGNCASAAFYDDKMSTVLQLPKEEEPLYIMPIGYNKKQNE